MSGLRDFVIETVAGVVGKAIEKFLEDEPSVAEKAEVGKRIAKQGLALIPREELVPFLTDGDAEVAEAFFRAAKAAKLAGKI
jgi:hypothetical protein